MTAVLSLDEVPEPSYTVDFEHETFGPSVHDEPLDYDETPETRARDARIWADIKAEWDSRKAAERAADALDSRSCEHRVNGLLMHRGECPGCDDLMTPDPSPRPWRPGIHRMPVMGSDLYGVAQYERPAPQR